MTEVLEKPTAPAAAPAEPTKPQRAVFLTPGLRFQPREQLRQDFAVDAEAGTTIEDVLDPQYWAHVAGQIAPYARIEVLAETGDWMLELLVTGVGRNWVKVKLLHRFDLEQMTETLGAADRFTIEWKGPHHKFAVIRKADQMIVQGTFHSRVDAAAWLANHERVTAT